MDRGEPTYQTYKKAVPLFRILLPLALLIAVVGIVSGLVLGGVIQGDAQRTPTIQTTTPPTMLVVP